MSILCLIVRLAGERVALPAAEVESVVEISTVTPVPRTQPHICGLSALRSRVLTVVQSRTSLQIDTVDSDANGESKGTAVVATIDGHPYALLVDAIEDVVEIFTEVSPIRTALTGGWQRAAQGSVEFEGELMLLVDIRALISGPTREAA